MSKFIWIISLVIILVQCQESPKQKQRDNQVVEVVPAILPFSNLELTSLDAFELPSSNWQTAGDVRCDLDQKHHLQSTDGDGILVNILQESGNKNLHTKMEHGDLEIHMDVMMPKSSNSGIYFQSRYEIQLFDSWGKDDVDFSDIGGIYQRWDDARSESERGYEGTEPKVNAAKAPGLWQHFHILFRAPRFDEQGQKIQNAMFEFVKLNGYTLHKNVVVSGPTRAGSFSDEVPSGPLMLQGDHGPVAFKNIRYKTYGFDTLEIKNLTFEMYVGKWDFIPDWDTLTPVSSGKVTLLDPKSVSDQPDHYGIVFQGLLDVRTEGTYLFETSIDDGGDLFIDSTLVVANEGEPGGGTERGTMHLKSGQHPFKLTYYQEIWAASIRLEYEGPGISKRPLASEIKVPDWLKDRLARPRLTIHPNQQPELLRGFVDHGPIKITHAISVGDPRGIHFSYNLANASIIKSWKGGFADVTDMWRGRGISQLTIPMNAAVEYVSGLSIARLTNEKANWPNYHPEGFNFLGYKIDDRGSPHFEYELNDVKLDDHIIPTDEGRLKRTLSFRNIEADSPVWHRIGTAPQISKLENGLYSIGGEYYVDIKSNVQTRRTEKGEELLAAISSDAESSIIEYEILW